MKSLPKLDLKIFFGRKKWAESGIGRKETINIFWPKVDLAECGYFPKSDAIILLKLAKNA